MRPRVRLEAGTHRNIEVIWPLRPLRPDFKAIVLKKSVLHSSCRLTRCSAPFWSMQAYRTPADWLQPAWTTKAA